MIGIHIVKKPLKRGDRYYVYAWRGGPCIHTEDYVYPDITPEILEYRAKARRRLHANENENFDVIIRDYISQKGEALTKACHYWLKEISYWFGMLPQSHLATRNFRLELVEVRKPYDPYATIVMSRLLDWAAETGFITENVIADLVHTDAKRVA